MTTQTLNGNGRTRKSLADQIDRLDHILDGLADALNESIADGVRMVIGQIVSEAVQVAVKEVLTCPDLLQTALEKHSPPPPAPVPEAMPAPVAQPEPKRTWKEKLLNAGKYLCAKVEQAATLAKTTLRKSIEVGCAAGKCTAKIVEKLPTTLSAIGRAAWALRRPCATAVCAGVLVGVSCYFGGHVFSSVANGLTGAAVTLSALLLPIKHLFLGNKNSA